jgi:hypothetical protein
MKTESIHKGRMSKSKHFNRITQIHLTKLGIAAAALIWLTATPLVAQTSNIEPFLPVQVRAVSTVPGNGDVNPYGVAFVPANFPTGGTIAPGNILVSNFNNSMNLQGTGTTIISVPSNNSPGLFFQGKAGLGLTTALNVLQKGFVLVGNFPSPNGSCTDSTAGSILVINDQGTQVGTIAGPFVDGPWDSALFDQGTFAELFVANALNGTVVRFNLLVTPFGVHVLTATRIASGYAHQCDPVTFVDGPAGLVYNPANDTLYVASTLDNAVYAVPQAAERIHDSGKGALIYQDNVHLHGALAMTMAPNGHLLVANNDAINSDTTQPSEIVEFTVQGQFVKQISVDPLQGGAFGLATMTSGGVTQFAAVDDVTNNLLIWFIPVP